MSSIFHVSTANARARGFASQIRCSVLALILMSAGPASVELAQDMHAQGHGAPQAQDVSPEQKAGASALIKVIRDSAERYKNVSVAMAEGYALQFGCVSGGESGAMGLHYVNGNLV